MSIYKALGEGPGWPSYRLQLHPTANLDLGEQSSVTLDSVHERGHIPGSDGQPVLEPHESFSYTVSSPSCPIPYFQRPLGQAIIPRATMGYSPPGHDYRFTRPKNDSGPATTAYSAITLTSPTSQQVPPSGEEGDESTEDDDEMLITCGKTGGEASENSVPKTAAERRAEKRKMKRFRLTHNQTRFLMSEFTRHAHPDAAQRERLSKEIPGLSPRQVQVWFQNRRAKLKRFTTDDRERMMRSRALPDGFNTVQALYSPFTNATQSYSTPMPSPTSYASAYGDGRAMQPLLVDGLRRQSMDDVTVSPISMNSALGSFYTPPGSGPTSENPSPVSPASERSQLLNHSTIQTTSPRNPDPFLQPSSFSTTCHTYRQPPRFQFHERRSSMRAEPLASPQWSRPTYSGNTPEYVTSQMSSHEPFSEPGLWEPIKCGSLDAADISYNCGLANGSSHGLPSSTPAQPRQTVDVFPSGFGHKAPYRSFLPTSTFHPAQSTQGFQSASLTMPQDFHLPQLDGPFHPAFMNTGYASTYGVAGPCGYQDSPKTESIIIEEQVDERHPALITSTTSLPRANSCSSEGTDTRKVNPQSRTVTGTRRSSMHLDEFNISRESYGIDV